MSKRNETLQVSDVAWPRKIGLTPSPWTSLGRPGRFFCFVLLCFVLFCFSRINFFLFQWRVFRVSEQDLSTSGWVSQALITQLPPNKGFEPLISTIDGVERKKLKKVFFSLSEGYKEGYKDLVLYSQPWEAMGLLFNKVQLTLSGNHAFGI